LKIKKPTGLESAWYEIKCTENINTTKN